MFEKIKKIFKKKPKAKVEVEKEVLVLAEDMTFENEIKKPEVTETVTETKSETKSSLTFGE
ncbi:hypothetical protein [uncultured Mediterranean phage uvMED]|jgi:hypothetical protein|nr:hypothetical protein [uncultured Mediterranean phage uvMED]BAR37614.1 hypothetical protein [uncultured Mediterranean phage uvMED]|tara:strand:- start:131 stop:313 length:183 start_codon:yes stop_codon:yes gene_type:complete